MLRLEVDTGFAFRTSQSEVSRGGTLENEDISNQVSTEKYYRKDHVQNVGRNFLYTTGSSS